MRLIDADELKKVLKSGCERCHDANTNWCEHCCKINDFEDLIEDAPTVAVNCNDCDGYEAGYSAGLKDAKRPQGDLISREALKNHKFLSPDNPDVTRVYDEKIKAYQQGWNDAIDAIIDNAPTVEANSIIDGLNNEIDDLSENLAWYINERNRLLKNADRKASG